MTAISHNITREQDHDKFMKTIQDIITCLSSNEVQCKTCELTLKRHESQPTEITLFLEYSGYLKENSMSSMKVTDDITDTLCIKGIILMTHINAQNCGKYNNNEFNDTESIKEFASKMNIDICDPNENPEFGLHFELSSVREMHEFETFKVFNEKTIPKARLNKVLRNFYSIIESSNIKQENNVLHTITCCHIVCPACDNKGRVLKDLYDGIICDDFDHKQKIAKNIFDKYDQVSNDHECDKGLYYMYVLMIKDNEIKQNIQHNLSELVTIISTLFFPRFWDIKALVGVDINERFLHKYVFM